MSLIVEDGTGLSTAESYCSVANADTRMSGFGNDTWDTLTTAEKEEALRRATTYMEQAYRTRWLGTRSSEDQALSWPRYILQLVDGWTIASDTVPAEVKNACADLAIKAAAGDLNEDLSRGIVREKTGPIETEFDAYSPQFVRYRAIDMMLGHLLTGGGCNAVLVRR